MSETTTTDLPDRYEHVASLGTSTQVVRNVETGEESVLRVLGSEDGARIRRELERIQGLPDHDSLVRILEVGELENGCSYYVQERVEGADLFSWALERDPIEIITLWTQLLGALACFQAGGLVPRGERRMVLRVEEREGQPLLRLVDPGGVMDEGSREPRSGQGLAPERRVGARIDRRASIYEAGLVLYELLSGSDALSLPGFDLEPSDTARLAPGLPADLASFVMVLLRPFPNDRPSTFHSALASLERVTGQQLSADLAPTRLPAPAPFMGRSTELARLRALAEPLLTPKAAGERAGLVLVSGPEGAGRRRIVDELALRLDLEDVTILRGVCGEGGQAPFGPLAQIYRQLLAKPVWQRRLAELPANRAWALRSLLPELAASLPTGRAPAPLNDPQAAKQRLRDGLIEPLIALSRTRALAILLDDVERARPETLEFLGQLARSVAIARRIEPGKEPVPAPRLLVIGTCTRLPDLGSELGVEHLELGPLSVESVRSLARGALALEEEAPLPDGLAETLDLRAEGSSGHVLRLVREHVGLKSPPSPKLSGRLLRTLACLDRAADPRLLAQATKTSPGQAERSLLCMVTRGEAERFGDLFHLAIRLDATEADPELAGRLARFLAVSRVPGEGRRERELEVAELAACGREGDLLLRFAPPAITYLSSLGADLRAATLAEALGRAEEKGCGSLRRAAELYMRAGELERSEQLLRELIDEPGDRLPQETAGLWRTLTEGLLAREQEREARAALSWAHSYLAEEEGVEVERAQVCAQGARLHLLAEESAEARERCEEGLGVLAELSDLPREGHQARAQLLGLLGLSLAMDEDLREARQMHKAALAIQEREGFSEDGARTLVRLGRVAFESADDAMAESHWSDALEAYERLQDRRGAAQVCSSLALSASRRGRLADARELLGESLRLRDTMGDRHGAASSLHNLGYVYRCAGALTEAAAAFRRGLRLRLSLDDRWYAALAANSLGEVLCDLGRLSEAHEFVRQALVAHQEHGDRLGEARSLSILTELERRRGDLTAARQGLALVERIRAEHPDLESRLDTLKLRARVSLALGHTDKARRAAEAALAMTEENEVLSHFEADARLLLGQVYARRSRGRGRARREVERARRSAERVGARYTTRAAAIELASLRLAGGHPRDARALLDSRPVPRPGRMRPLEGRQPPDRRGLLRVRERLLRARIELALVDGSVTTAARCAEQALEEARRSELADLIWRSLQVVAATAELRGAHERALSLTLEAQEQVELLVASTPEDHREGFLECDSLRMAALRGDSPVQALNVLARPPTSEGGTSGPEASEDMLQAMVAAVRPTIQPATRHSAETVTSPRPLVASAGLEFTALVRLNRLVVDEPSLDAVHEAIVREAVGLCGAERGFLAVFGETADQARVLATVGIDEVEQGQRFFRRCAFKAASTGRVVLSAEARVRSELKQEAHVVGLGLRSVLAAPVSVPDGQRGALYLDASFQVGLFRDRQVELTMALADLCAMSIGRGILESALHDKRGFPAPGPEQRRYLEVQASSAQAPVSFGHGEDRIVGCSQILRKLVDRLRAAARSQASVLVSGPPGVGKGVLARALHSERGGKRLVVCDLRELRADRVEAELFGYVAGSIDGASEPHTGLLLQACGGTLLLEHLPAAPIELQQRLCRALEDRWIRPLGGTEEIPLEGLCVIATTSEDVDEVLRCGRLDQSLALLVGQIRLELPALDRRPEDKGPLIEALLEQWPRESGALPPRLLPSALQALEARSYPTENARELNAVLSAGIVLAGDDPVAPHDLPPDRSGSTRPLRLALSQFERRYVEDALLANRSDLTATAKALGITRRTLKRKLEQLRIAP